MRTIVKPPYIGRTAHRAAVQYRHKPYCAPGIRISFHYGRGIPIRYSWLSGGPDRVESIAQMIRDADNGIPAEQVIALEPVTVD